LLYWCCKSNIFRERNLYIPPPLRTTEGGEKTFTRWKILVLERR
jgi:hypothetical protein